MVKHVLKNMPTPAHPNIKAKVGKWLKNGTGGARGKAKAKANSSGRLLSAMQMAQNTDTAKRYCPRIPYSGKAEPMKIAKTQPNEIIIALTIHVGII